DWVVSGPLTSATDRAGTALFALSCQAAGPAPLSVSVGGAAATALGMPDCASPPTTTVTTLPFGPGTSPPTFFPPFPSTT
ncbi:MAG: hypothetical protein DLM65_06815, partial [Candidatus Aeolococcus gillhamiae]